jgi:hypothetical protein
MMFSFFQIDHGLNLANWHPNAFLHLVWKVSMWHAEHLASNMLQKQKHAKPTNSVFERGAWTNFVETPKPA